MNTLEFAEYELKRYTATMGIYPELVLSVNVEAFDTSRFFQFDAKYDDAFSIAVTNGKGSIVATNERAVLLGVYHFLKRQGCRFIHPEQGGEYIPTVDAVADVNETWYAKTRHRGTTDGCGAGEGRSIDTILRYLDWLPKVMGNSFFTELTDYYSAVKALYKYGNNPYKTADELSREQFETYDKMIVDTMKQRGLLRHGAGHGWTLELLGLKDVQRGPCDTPCPRPEIMAITGGKRQYFNERPLFTNLCYSQDGVRREFVEMVYRYSVEHPEVDFIHVWLADYFANFCECEECKKLTPTDWYVKLLNEIDAEFTKHGSDKKIVFLAYFELAYPPLTERIQNPDRFVLMFAPYGRNFKKRYSEEKAKPYELLAPNGFKREEHMDMGLYLSQLQDWKKLFHGDSFMFDYVFCNGESPYYFTEITHVGYAKVGYDDNLYLKNLDLNGRVDCANIRLFMPTALAYQEYYSSLFYGEDVSYDEVYKDFFVSCYGKGEPVSAFLTKMNEYMPNALADRGFNLTEEERAKLEEGRDCLRAFKKEFFTYVPENAAQRLNCFYFREYLDVLETIQTGMLERSSLTEEQRKEKGKEFHELIYRTESKMPGIINPAAWIAHFDRYFS